MLVSATLIAIMVIMHSVELLSLWYLVMSYLVALLILENLSLSFKSGTFALLAVSLIHALIVNNVRMAKKITVTINRHLLIKELRSMDVFLVTKISKLWEDILLPASYMSPSF